MEKSPIDKRDLFAKNIYNKYLKIPKTLDLRNNMNDIRQYEDSSQSGAFVGASIKEWQENKEIYFEGFFSTDYIYNKRVKKDETSKCMDSRTVMKILNKYGSLPETSYSNSYSDEFMAEGFKIYGYAQVKTINECKKALYKNGPCLITFPMYNKTEKMWEKRDGSGNLGHAMSIVGYTVDSFIVRNSFGEKWGDKGHCYYPFNEWGAHWEIWSCIDDKSHQVSKFNNCTGNFGKCFGN